ncbi:AMP-binding protein [Psychromonas sp.]|uniref:AMP-binding protein n=1 Tax=Psychromonas sp. TaxID=1884585 RepID=UPI003565E6DE
MDKQLEVCPVRFQARVNAHATAIQADALAISYQRLDWTLERIAEQLAHLNLQAGDRLICIAENSLNLILLQLTCIRTGIIFCPLNPRFSEQEISQRSKVLNSTFIWLEDTSRHTKLSSLPIDFTLAEKGKTPLEPLKIDAQKVSNIIFTSGSSGQPKAVMHCFSNHYYSALASQSLIPLQPGDRCLLSLPLFHISGFATVMRALIAGATLLISSQQLSVTLLKREKITHLSLVSTQLYRLLGKRGFQAQALSLKHLLLGGSTFPERLLKQTGERGFVYHLSYGLSEMSSQVATSTNSNKLQLLPEQQVKIIDNEIYLRGKMRFVGYYNGDLTADRLPEKQWFASKDSGSLIGRQLIVSGRKDRLMISGGENIQAEELESVLLNFGYVKQAVVVAVTDPVFGERPVAFINWVNDKDKQVQLKSYLQDKLTTYKQPVHYLPLPKQNSIKVSLQTLQVIAQTRHNNYLAEEN